MLGEFENMLDKKRESDDIDEQLDAMPFIKEFRFKIALIIVSILGAILSVLIFFLSARSIAPPVAYFVDEGGQVFTTPSSLYPVQSKEVVKDFARQAILKTYTFDFLDLETQLGNAKIYFSSEAWTEFKRVMLSSQIVKEVKKNRYVVSAVLTEDPIITNSALSKGPGSEFAWMLVAPIAITFSGDGVPITKDYVVNATIIRVPTTENPFGLAVHVMSTGSSSGAKAK